MLWIPLFMYYLYKYGVYWMLWKTWKPGVSEETSVGSSVRAFHTFLLHPVLQSQATWIILMQILLVKIKSYRLSRLQYTTVLNNHRKPIHIFTFFPSNTPVFSVFPSSFFSLPLSPEIKVCWGIFKTESFWTILVSKLWGSKRHALWS